MTNRTNLRRRKAKDRRREEAKVDEVLERARRQAQGLSEPRSVYALADEIESEEAKEAVLEAIDHIVRKEMVEPLEPSRLIYRRSR